MLEQIRQLQNYIENLCVRMTGNNIKNNEYEIDYKIYPNPFVNSIHVELNIPYSTDYQISLFNAQGKLISILTKDYFEKDEFGFTWNFEHLNLKTGLYFLQVKSDKSVKNIRLIKAD